MTWEYITIWAQPLTRANAPSIAYLMLYQLSPNQAALKKKKIKERDYKEPRCFIKSGHFIWAHLDALCCIDFNVDKGIPNINSIKWTVL